MVVGRVTSCSPEQVVELLPARLLRTVLLQQQLLLAPDQLVLAAPQHGRPRSLLVVLCRRSILKLQYQTYYNGDIKSSPGRG